MVKSLKNPTKGELQRTVRGGVGQRTFATPPLLCTPMLARLPQPLRPPPFPSKPHHYQSVHDKPMDFKFRCIYVTNLIFLSLSFFSLSLPNEIIDSNYKNYNITSTFFRRVAFFLTVLVPHSLTLMAVTHAS